MGRWPTFRGPTAQTTASIVCWKLPLTSHAFHILCSWYAFWIFRTTHSVLHQQNRWMDSFLWSLHTGAWRGLMAPGAKSKFGAPMFDLELFWKQMYCIEKVLQTLLKVFGAPRSDSAPGELCPPVPPRYAPVHTTYLMIPIRFPLYSFDWHYRRNTPSLETVSAVHWCWDNVSLVNIRPTVNTYQRILRHSYHYSSVLCSLFCSSYSPS